LSVPAQHSAGTSVQVRTSRFQRVLVGSFRLIAIENEPELAKVASDRAARGETIVWAALDGRMAGFASLNDRPNPRAGDALEVLQKRGIHAVLLSGDKPLTVQAIARGADFRMTAEEKCSRDLAALFAAGESAARSLPPKGSPW
jgi:Cu2+-exporting ATPase